MRPLCKNRLGGEEVHALVPDDGHHDEGANQGYVPESNEYTARVRHTALEIIDVDVAAEERNIANGSMTIPT